MRTYGRDLRGYEGAGVTWKSCFHPVRAMAIFLFLLLGGHSAFAVPGLAGRDADCVALVSKAIAYYQSMGQEKAFAAFNSRETGEWARGESYVMVADGGSGVFLVHPLNPKLVNNTAIADLTDKRGKLIIREMVEAGRRRGAEGDWAEYVWTNPETKKVSAKRTFVRPYDGKIFMAGYYVE